MTFRCEELNLQLTRKIRCTNIKSTKRFLTKFCEYVCKSFKDTWTIKPIENIHATPPTSRKNERGGGGENRKIKFLESSSARRRFANQHFHIGVETASCEFDPNPNGLLDLFIAVLTFRRFGPRSGDAGPQCRLIYPPSDRHGRSRAAQVWVFDCASVYSLFLPRPPRLGLPQLSSLFPPCKDTRLSLPGRERRGERFSTPRMSRRRTRTHTRTCGAGASDTEEAVDQVLEPQSPRAFSLSLSLSARLSRFDAVASVLAPSCPAPSLPPLSLCCFLSLSILKEEKRIGTNTSFREFFQKIVERSG